MSCENNHIMKKILILTHRLDNNYGGLLQAFALQKVLKNLGHVVVTDRYGSKVFVDIGSKPKQLLRKLYYKFRGYRLVSKEDKAAIAVNTKPFIDNYIGTADFFHGQRVPLIPDVEKYDAFVVGSDQIWREGYCDVDSYFLSFVPDNKLKVAYAASFGKDNIDDWTPEAIERRKELLRRFNGVSVREDSGVALCKEKLNVDAVHVLDPSLLLDEQEYKKIIWDSKEDKGPQNYIFAYILDKSTSKKELLSRFSEKKSLSAISGMPEELLTRDTKQISKCVYASVADWLRWICNARYVITDSFHGVAFSIIFHKQFCVIANEKRGQSRIQSLLKIFQLEDRLITSYSDLESVIDRPIDYDAVDLKKKQWQDKSLNFLENILNA